MGSDRDALLGKTVEAVHRTVETVLTPQSARYEPTPFGCLAGAQGKPANAGAMPYLIRGVVAQLRNSSAIPLHSRLTTNQI